VGPILRQITKLPVPLREKYFNIRRCLQFFAYGFPLAAFDFRF